MAEHGFTPGPWLLESRRWHWGVWPTTIHEIVTEEVRGRGYKDYEYHVGICSIHNANAEGSYKGAGLGEYPSNDEAAANARLIAASPTLLEALEQIQHSIKQAMIPGNDWRRELQLIANTADAAITLATGKDA